MCFVCVCFYVRLRDRRDDPSTDATEEKEPVVL